MGRATGIQHAIAAPRVGLRSAALQLNPSFIAPAADAPVMTFMGASLWSADSVVPELDASMPKLRLPKGGFALPVYACSDREVRTDAVRQRLKVETEFHQRLVRNGLSYRSRGLANALFAAGIKARALQEDGSWGFAPLPDPRLRELLWEWAFANYVPLRSDSSANDEDEDDDSAASVGYRVARCREEGLEGAAALGQRAISMQEAFDGIESHAPEWLGTPPELRRVELPAWPMAQDLLETLQTERLTSTELAKRHFGAEDDESALRLASRVRAFIHKARERGVPILADRQGYWLPDGQSEVDEYLTAFAQRIAATKAMSERVEISTRLWYSTAEELPTRERFCGELRNRKPSPRAQLKAKDAVKRCEQNQATRAQERANDFARCKPLAKSRADELTARMGSVQEPGSIVYARMFGTKLTPAQERILSERSHALAYFKSEKLPPVALRPCFRAWLPERVVSDAEKYIASHPPARRRSR
jgi:hypothetical protein